jgi:hypothetical protein
MEVSRKDGNCFPVSGQEQIEAALISTGATFELCNYGNTYDVSVASQDQLQAVKSTIETQFDNLILSI